MINEPDIKRPILSICIPTYNRAKQLENLFKNLYAIKAMHGENIDICVSNNSSTDNTRMVIESWQSLLDLKVVTQSTNVGATLNAIEVTKMAAGRWIQIIGDDDELISSGVNQIVSLLGVASPETWVLVGIANGNGEEFLLGNLSGISYNASAFRKKMLQTGLYRYGFIGMHVIPSSYLGIYHNLSLEATKSWPHLALLLRYIGGNGAVMVCRSVVVKQAAGGAVLFWRAGDWVRVNLKKIDIGVVAKKECDTGRWFYSLLIMRELYSMGNIKNTFYWKVLEPCDFNRYAIDEYLTRYRAIGLLSIFVAGHFLLLLTMRTVSTHVFRFILRQLGRGFIISNYAVKKEEMKQFDGVTRRL